MVAALGMASSPSVTIIIPVYGGASFVERCVRSVLEHTAAQHRVLVIDDASPDEETPKLLDALAQSTRAELVRQPENRGFVRTVNHGYALAGRDDVVVLNSDTRVTPGWLEGLSACAASRPEVGTCSPMTNAGSIFALPEMNVNNPLPRGWSEADVAALLERVSPRAWPQVPTAHGFCMYVKRALLDDVGGFDEEAFGKGYGEENDLCLRAQERGWIHLADDATFVFHEGSGSFGAEKQARLEVSRRVLRARYPYFKQATQQWIAADPHARLRARVTAAFAQPPTTTPSRARPRLLLVLHGGRGGVLHTTRDLVGALLPEFDIWELTSNRARFTLTHHHLGGHAEARVLTPRTPPQLLDITQVEYRAIFESILDEVRPDLVHVRHLLAHTHDPVRVAKQRGLPVVLSVHDHYLVCPTFQLVDNRGRYCAGQCNSDAEDCNLTPGWFPQRPRLKNHYLTRWRGHVQDTLRSVDHLITTSAHARDLTREFYPDIPEARFSVIEHGRDLERYPKLDLDLELPLKVVSFGALGDHKGLASMEALAERLDPRRVELHLVGAIPRAVSGKLTTHGPYERDALPATLQRIRPALALLPSIMPETYCHTLTEAWAMGLPVMGADRGARQERIGRDGGGWLVDPNDPDAMRDRLHALADHVDEVRAAREQALQITFSTVADMAEAYARIYRELAPRAAERPAATAGGRALAEAELRTLEPHERVDELPNLRIATKYMLYQLPPIRRWAPRISKLVRRIRPLS